MFVVLCVLYIFCPELLLTGELVQYKLYCKQSFDFAVLCIFVLVFVFVCTVYMFLKHNHGNSTICMVH